MRHPFALLALIALNGANGFAAAKADRLAPGRFDYLHRQIRPQAGEQRFWQIPWTLSLTEARQRAAAVGKPILIWAGAGGAPIGVC
ncbi:MAG: hypothetical protein FJ386_07045 [Verrucomicrobia bacterium]|nr:hypothetical protein [Verrucomicrobiota bacterium]